ncbi:MAG: carbohydrate kinase family protein [Chloroflexi bacterium]|nr:carbohydrate kinase family protein [Chloroflexota bacterium]
MSEVLVVGELNVDLILSQLNAFPAPGKEVLAQDMDVVLGSSSAICAAGLAKLGAQVGFVGRVGNDAYGRFVLRALERLGVDTTTVRVDPDVRTGATVSLVYRGDRALVTYLGSIATLRAEDVPVDCMSNYRHLHVSSYYLQKNLQEGLPLLYRQARALGLTTSLDVGYDPEESWQRDRVLALLHHVNFFLPNEGEACALADTGDVEEAAAFLARHVQDWVIVKRGAEGALAHARDGRRVHVPAFPVTVVDTTGAGDSFNAGFIYAYALQRMPIEDALRFAAVCGALSTTGIGGTAAQPSLEQVWEFLRQH